jgi:hypothetical protein
MVRCSFRLHAVVCAIASETRAWDEQQEYRLTALLI